MKSFYETDLAYIHHTGFGDFARNAAPTLLRILRARAILRGRVLDLGCGSGIWAAALTRAGYDVLGLDISPAMIKLARANAPRAQLQVASMFRAALPSCVAITALGEVLNYQIDPHGHRELQKFFARVYSALLPGGVFVFDIAEPGYVANANPERTFVEGKRWAVLLEKEEDRVRETLTRRMTIFRQVGRHFRRSTEVHRVQLYRGSALAEVLRRVGFKVQLRRGYGAMLFRKGVRALICSK